MTAFRTFHESRCSLTFSTADFDELQAKARLALMNVPVRANPDDWREENKFQQLNILNDHIWFHKGRQSQIPLAASALFTYLSPSTRHPLAFNCNFRQTQDRKSVV